MARQRSSSGQVGKKADRIDPAGIGAGLCSNGGDLSPDCPAFVRYGNAVDGVCAASRERCGFSAPGNHDPAR